MTNADHLVAQPAGGLTSNEPFVSGHVRALVVIGLFVAYIATTLFSVVMNLMRFSVPTMIIGGEGTQDQLTLAELFQFFAALGALATFLVYVALVVAFLVWLHRVSKNVPALGNAKSGVEYTPGWAVGGFFIPFANLYMPYKAVREVWEKSDPAIRTEDDIMFTPPASTPLLLGWWVMWIASNVLSNIAWRLQSGVWGADTERFVTGIDIVSDVLGIVAAALAILVVRGIDRRQAERARHVAYIPHMPPPPPLFTPPPPPQGA